MILSVIAADESACSLSRRVLLLGGVDVDGTVNAEGLVKAEGSQR